MNKTFTLKDIPPHLWVALSSLISKGIVAIAQIISIRLVIEKTDANTYSAFALLSALSGWALLTDCGIGSSLQNFISEERVANKYVYNFILNGVLAVGGLVAVFISIFLVISPFISEVYLGHISSINKHDSLVAFNSCIIMFTISMLGTVFQKIMFALHRGWVGNLVPAIGSVLGISNLCFLKISLFSTPLLSVVIYAYLPTAILSLISFAYIIIIGYKEIEATYDFQIIKRVLKRGLGFFGFAVAANIVMQSDFIVMSQSFIDSDIVIYSIMQKVFGFVLFVYLSFLQALWPICTELRIKGRWEDIKILAFNHMAVGFLGIVSFTTMFYFYDDYIISLFSTKYRPTTSLILFFGFYYVIRVWTDTYGMLLQSMNVIKPLLVLVPIQAFFTVILQIYLGQMFGSTGLVVGLIIAYLLTVSSFCPLVFYQFSKGLA